MTRQRYGIALAIAVGSSLICAGANAQSVRVEYNAREATYVVPPSVTKLFIKAWGGGGGGGFADSNGGGGGFVSAMINLSEGARCHIRVGGGGRYSSQSPSTWQDWPSPGAGRSAYGGGGDTWVVGSGGQGGGRTEIECEGSLLIAGGGGGASDGNTGYGPLHATGGGRDDGPFVDGRDGEPGEISTGGGGGGGWRGGARGTVTAGGKGGSSGASGAFYNLSYAPGEVWLAGGATDPDCRHCGYGGIAQSNGAPGLVVILPVSPVKAFATVQDEAIYDNGTALLYPSGTAAAGVVATEGTVWDPSGGAHIIGKREGKDAFRTVVFKPVFGPGTYWYQARVIDSFSNYQDAWVSFEKFDGLPQYPWNYDPEAEVDRPLTQEEAFGDAFPENEELRELWNSGVEGPLATATDLLESGKTNDLQQRIAQSKAAGHAVALIYPDGGIQIIMPPGYEDKVITGMGVDANGQKVLYYQSDVPQYGLLPPSEADATTGKESKRTPEPVGGWLGIEAQSTNSYPTKQSAHWACAVADARNLEYYFGQIAHTELEIARRFANAIGEPWEIFGDVPPPGHHGGVEPSDTEAAMNAELNQFGLHVQRWKGTRDEMSDLLANKKTILLVATKTLNHVAAEDSNHIVLLVPSSATSDPHTVTKVDPGQTGADDYHALAADIPISRATSFPVYSSENPPRTDEVWIVTR